ncbi:class I SAM-dependent methyltransferase [Brevundimonas sp. BAL450]|jgi:predicted methyltransferase|uniref:class I SAM-dependent methyltransferase n=1 Tax=Brevundimonas TaxID=41275 RepID=UPI0018C947CD|nr:MULTISPECIES: methyltransferase domain-containing protein [Brevundimonas]MBG7614438.1 class I SAM-dependent methyltransferase [Brevundimonas sp. BAL450]
MRRLTLAAALLALTAPAALAQTPDAPARGSAAAPVHAEDAVLADIIASDTRAAANTARDQHRRPYEALTFWGLRPGLTVVEIEPGGAGWWTEILAPYAQRTGGEYVAAWIDLEAPTVSDRAREARAGLEQELAAFGGSARAVNFGPASGLGVEDGTADVVLVARAFHNWARADLTDRYMAEFFRALKPGGILAVEQHRAEEGLNATDTASTGYVPESYVIRAAQAAGFELDARSELNANAADDRDHPFGVWTLPPVRRTEQGGRTLTEAERAAFDAIGESDRMTLRFRKPE